MNFKFPKYSVEFLIFIVITKVLYLFLEVYYNGHLIDTVTSKDVTKSILENIESMGHNVSSLGLTLLTLPIIYLIIKLLFKNIDKIKMSVSIFISIFILFFSYHQLLVKLMDNIVEENKDKRYSSYYITAFKYGMLNEYMGYDLLIPEKRLKDMKIEDKVMITNMFLLNYLDKNITNKIINQGQNQLIEIFLSKYGNEKYLKSKKEFDEKAEEIANAYNEYLSKSKELNKKFKLANNEDIFKVTYKDFLNTVYLKFDNYQKKVDAYNEKVWPHVTNEEVNSIYYDLKKFFKNSKYKRAQREYRKKMNKKFGHYIQVTRWCDNGCPSRKAIKEVIWREFQNEWEKSSKIVPNLTQTEFFKDPEVKRLVISELKKQDLKVSNNFNYSQKQFQMAYNDKVKRSFKTAKNKFKNKLKEKLKVDIKFGLNYHQFLKLFKKDFIKEYGEIHGNKLYKMLVNKSTEKYYDDFYKPYFIDKHLSKYLLSEKDFDKKENIKKGEDSIKNLYIPPFAVFMSLSAGVLNFVSLLVIILFSMTRIDKLNIIYQIVIKSIVKSSILLFLIYIPFKDNINIVDKYPILEKLKSNENGKKYFKILEWTIYYEKINYKHLYNVFR